MPRHLSDSDWGEDADSGKAIQPDHFPNSVSPNQPAYSVEWVDVEDEENYAPGTIPFLVDMGGRKIFLAPEGSLHAQIMQIVGGELIGPINRGYVISATGRVSIPASDEDYDDISKTLRAFFGRDQEFKFGRLKRDPSVCPECDELYENCKCLSWGEGADWASDPIDQSSIREMKPGIQARVAGMEKFIGSVPTEFMSQLREYDRPEVEDLQEDIAENGINEPLWIDFNDLTGEVHLSEGNHRIAIAEKLGLPTVPVGVYRSQRKSQSPNGLRFKYIGPERDHLGNPSPPQYMHPSDIGLPVVDDLSPQQKAAAWDKPSNALSAREMAHVLAKETGPQRVKQQIAQVETEYEAAQKEYAQFYNRLPRYKSPGGADFERVPRVARPVSDEWWEQRYEDPDKKLFHGTTLNALDWILGQQEGVVPWDDEEKAPGTPYRDWIRPRPGHTYMGQNLGAAMNASQMAGANWPIALQINPRHLKPNLVNPDEDDFYDFDDQKWINQPNGIVTYPKPGDQSNYVSLGDWAEAMNLGGDPEATARHLEQKEDGWSGVAYNGSVPFEAIEGVWAHPQDERFHNRYPNAQSAFEAPAVGVDADMHYIPIENLGERRND